MDTTNTHKHKNFLTMGLIAGAIVGVVGVGVGLTFDDAKTLILSPALGIFIAGAGLMLEAVSVQERIYADRTQFRAELKEKYSPRTWEEIQKSISTIRDDVVNPSTALKLK